jgi:hypothetical protein
LLRDLIYLIFALAIGAVSPHFLVPTAASEKEDSEPQFDSKLPSRFLLKFEGLGIFLTFMNRSIQTSRRDKMLVNVFSLRKT